MIFYLRNSFHCLFLFSCYSNGCANHPTSPNLLFFCNLLPKYCNLARGSIHICCFRNDELYNDNSQQISIEKIQRICRKEDTNNSRKIWNEKRSRLLKNLSNPEISQIASKERKINLVLDNARIHHAKIVEKACEILNINLIFLQPYCPDLNPIEDVWRKIKSKIYKSIYETLNELIEIFKEEYYKIVDLTSFYENWVNEYLGTNIW